MTRRASAPPQQELPLISQRFLRRLTIATAALLLTTLAITMGGRWLGERMALGGNTESDEILPITIGEDTLQIPANTIRFEEQRKAGKTERVDLYVTWPGMQGYSPARRASFDNIDRPDLLVFLQISQSTMSKDMSGRLQPIYAQLFDGAPLPFHDGLTLHRLRAASGYGQEVLLTAERPGKPDYAVRCLLPAAGEKPTGGDCQRDIRVGNDLTVLYRFSSTLLKDWDHIDAAIDAFVSARLKGADTKEPRKDS